MNAKIWIYQLSVDSWGNMTTKEKLKAEKFRVLALRHKQIALWRRGNARNVFENMNAQLCYVFLSVLATV